MFCKATQRTTADNGLTNRGQDAISFDEELSGSAKSKKANMKN